MVHCRVKKGGKEDVVAISSKEHLELVDILSILETGQMLDFIEVKSWDVSITEEGYSILKPAQGNKNLY